jgi:hypothetical protein
MTLSTFSTELNQRPPSEATAWASAPFACPHCLVPFMRWSAALKHLLTPSTCAQVTVGVAAEFLASASTFGEFFSQLRQLYMSTAATHAGHLVVPPLVWHADSRRRKAAADSLPGPVTARAVSAAYGAVPAGYPVSAIREGELLMIEAELQRAVHGGARARPGSHGTSRLRRHSAATGLGGCVCCGMSGASGLWLPCGHEAEGQCRSCAVVALGRAGGEGCCRECTAAVEGVGGF